MGGVDGGVLSREAEARRSPSLENLTQETARVWWVSVLWSRYGVYGCCGCGVCPPAAADIFLLFCADGEAHSKMMYRILCTSCVAIKIGLCYVEYVCIRKLLYL